MSCRRQSGPFWIATLPDKKGGRARTKTAYYLNRKLSVVALVSQGVRLPKGPWIWVANGSLPAWQVEKMLTEAFPVLKGTVLTFITLKSDAEVKAFERALQGRD